MRMKICKWPKQNWQSWKTSGRIRPRLSRVRARAGKVSPGDGQFDVILIIEAHSQALAPALAEVGSKMVSLASVESNADLATALRRLGKTWEAAGSIAQAQVGRVSSWATWALRTDDDSQAISDNIILSDSLGYQSLHARQAKVITRFR